MSDPIIIAEITDVTDACLNAAEQVFDGWFDNEESIDWERFWDRLEMWGWTVRTTDCPAVKKIQKHIRKYRNT